MVDRIKHIKLLLFHPTGNANVRAVAEGLANTKVLFAYYTTVATFKGSFLYKIGAIPPLKELRRRMYNKVLAPLTITYSKYELGRVISAKFGLGRLIMHETGIFSIDSVYRNLDKKVASKLPLAQKNGVNAVYAYEDGAEFTFEKAKKYNIKCFYDLPTGYWKASRKLLDEEIARRPEWKDTFTGFKDSTEKLDRKDKELALSDVILVASQFTADTLKEYHGKLSPVETIPYGFPPVYEEREFESFEKPRKLKLLFVGKLSQQKGLADIFESIEGLDQLVELTLIGSKSHVNCKALDEGLAKHNYIGTKSHNEVLEIMRKHDLLLFPSLFDGFGMVITEAMSQGTPVIASDRSAGPDLIKHGNNGWLMSAGYVADLRKIIEEILTNPSILKKVGLKAMETARQRPWQKYGADLFETLQKYMNE